MPLKLYLEDPYRRMFDAEVVASAEGRCALSRTAFYPGGGGQPADRGRLFAGAEELPVGGTEARTTTQERYGTGSDAISSRELCCAARSTGLGGMGSWNICGGFATAEVTCHTPARGSCGPDDTDDSDPSPPHAENAKAAEIPSHVIRMVTPPA